MHCNKCLTFYETLIFRLGLLFLALGRALVGEMPTPAAEGASHASPVNWSKLTYSKIGDSVVDLTRDAIRDKSHGATPATGWLLLVITRRINRKTNRAEMSIADLERASGMTRQTIITHTAILESLGFVTVDRAAISRSRNAVNVFHLSGIMAQMTLINFSESNYSTPPVEIFSQGVQILDRKENNRITEQHAAAVVEMQPAESKVNDSEAADVPGEDSFDGDPSYESLIAHGIEKSLARHLTARFSPERIAAVLARSRHPRIDDPAAFAVRALNRGWTWEEALPPVRKSSSKPAAQSSGSFLDNLKNSQYVHFLVNYDDLDSTQGDEDATAPPDDVEITREVEVPYAS